MADEVTLPQCDCGYECRGLTIEDRVSDAQRHARDAHGIEVSRHQVLASAEMTEVTNEAAQDPAERRAR